MAKPVVVPPEFSIARAQALLSSLYREFDGLVADPEGDGRRWALRTYIGTLQTAIERALLDAPMPEGWWTPREKQDEG